MRRLTQQSAAKLQNILSKRLGRILTDTELEEAYDALMDFAFALVDMSDEAFVDTSKLPVENSK